MTRDRDLSVILGDPPVHQPDHPLGVAKTVTRAVEIGVRGEACVEIRSGLSAGDRVATS